MATILHPSDEPVSEKLVGNKNPNILRVLAACLCLDDLYVSIRGVCGKIRTRISRIIK